MEWKTLTYRTDGAVAVVTANRPHVLNAQSRLMIEEVTAAFDEAADDAATRALIVASDDARFADRSVRWGGAHVQYANLPWDVGGRKAKEFLFTGDWISADEAHRLGLVNCVVPRQRLEEETMALAQRIALQDPFALRMAKLSVNQALDLMGQRGGPL